MIVKVLMAVMPPTIAWSTWLPGGKSGTMISLVKVPSTSVLGPGGGRTWTLPIFKEETGAKPGKWLPVTATLEPDGLAPDATEIDAEGTEWLAVDVAGRLTMVAVTVLLEGIDTPIGTENVTSKSPGLSGVTLATWILA